MEVKDIHSFIGLTVLAVVAAICIAVTLPAITHAYSAETYQTDNQFMPGSLVELGAGGKFELADISSHRYVGVAAHQTGSSFELITSGTAHILVSDMDGDISGGDRIGLSNVKGLASRLVSGRQEVGTALADLSSSSPGWKKIDGSGEAFYVARIPVQLGSAAEIKNGSVVTSLQRAVETILNKPVALWRVIAALTVGIGGLLLAFFLVVSASREAFASLGRNPLASSAILKGLWKIVAVALVIVLTSLLVSYLIASLG